MRFTTLSVGILKYYKTVTPLVIPLKKNLQSIKHIIKYSQIKV